MTDAGAPPPGAPPPPPRLRRLAALAAVATGAFVAWLLSLALTNPDVTALTVETPQPTSFMRWRAAQLGEPERAARAVPVELERVAPLAVCAVVKAEDPSFFRHQGIEWGRVRRNVEQHLGGGRAKGASTVTQQLARNLFLTPERSATRKLREAFLARDLEATLSKRRILELYLNVAEWGPSVWGIARAADHYFGKPPSELDAFEASLLGALLPAPRAALAGDNLARASGVQRRVLFQLYASGLLDAQGWVNATQRAVALHAALGAGDPLAVALARPAPPPAGASKAPPRLEDAPLLHADALALGCGLDREVREADAFRERQAASGEAAPAPLSGRP